MNTAARKIGQGEDVLTEFRDYAYGVSHDIGAPVRSMVEFSRLLEMDHEEEMSNDARLYLSLIIRNGEKLQQMMGGLLDYSRLNTEARDFATVDCDTILENVSTRLGPTITVTNAQIECARLPHVEGDARQIERLFFVLLDNALKFQPPFARPHIGISAERQGEQWRFSVADNGIGIDPHFHDKIFGVFQRLHAPEDYPGIGMGLTLAQKIARRHGSEIAVDSRPDEGAIFHFTLPAAGGHGD